MSGCISLRACNAAKRQVEWWRPLTASRRRMLIVTLQVRHLRSAAAISRGTGSEQGARSRHVAACAAPTECGVAVDGPKQTTSPSSRYLERRTLSATLLEHCSSGVRLTDSPLQ